MFCPKCGKELNQTENKFCPGCGTPIGVDPTQPAPPTNPPSQVLNSSQDNAKKTKPKKPLYKKPWFIAIAVIVIIAAIGNMGKKSDPVKTAGTSTSEPTSIQSSVVSSTQDSKASDAPPAIVPERIELELTNGNYTTGIDLPAGKYDITWISGAGNVMSDNIFSGGINAIFGPNDGTGLYQQEYKNISLTDKCVLSIQNVTVKIVCEQPTSGVVKREQPNTETVSLGNGNFVAGTDFPEGVYNIQAVSGNGNVSSDNLMNGGINAIMGVDSDEMYQKEYKNINLPKGATVSISGVNINLVPSV